MTFKAWFRALTSVAPLALLACSDPSPPIAQGAVHYETASSPTAPSGYSCALAGGHYANVSGQDKETGYDKAPSDIDPGIRLSNGEHHAKVSCTVDGSKVVKFSGEIEGINSSDGHRARLSIRGELAEDGTGTATASALVEGLTYSSTEPCTVQGVIQNGEPQWGDDLVWATFRCPGMSDSAPNNMCQTKGTIVLENCK